MAVPYPVILAITSGALKKRSFIVEGLKANYQVDVIPGKLYKENWKDRVLVKLRLSKYFGTRAVNMRHLNASIINHPNHFDIIFIVKGNDIKIETLKGLRALKKPPIIVGWSMDNIYLNHNRTNELIRTAPYYDYYYTSKKINIVNNELKTMGFKKPRFYHQGYDPSIHLPENKSKSFFKGKVVFIGYAENDRFEKMNYLAMNGIEVHIWGNGWKTYIKKHENIHIHNRELRGKEYSEALSNSLISLCFLRKLNRDQHTSRSFEIPACRGFMLAERTDEHLTYFKEDEEAAYFNDKHELLNKVRYFLKNIERRDQIAEAGYQRCLNSDYSYDVIAKKIIEETLDLNRYTLHG